MQGTRAVQVVLGEGEPGILRLVLEAQGFDVVGHARDDAELRRIVGLTRPDVIVLDAGISGPALIDTQIRSDYVPIVVVWPKDTYTPAAEERVDPSTAVLELGNAVRRVIERHAEPIRVPDIDDEEPDPAVVSPGRRRGPGRTRHALVLAAAWTIALTALAAIGLAVPSAFRDPRPAGSLHPFRDRPELALTADREGPGIRPDAADRGPTCVSRGPARSGPPGRGHAIGLGRGCSLGHEKNDTPANRGSGKGHGRPDDPGEGSGPSEEHGAPTKEKKEKSGDDPSDNGSDHRGRAGRSTGDEGGSPGPGKGSGTD